MMHSAPRVLIVDDDKFMRSLLERVFGNAGIAAKTFASAIDLLDSNELHPPAVLLLDVMMPGTSGLQLQELLIKRGVTLPVMFLTGDSDIPIAVSAMRKGAVDFLEKPFSSVELVKRVRRAFEPIAKSAATPAPEPLSEHARRLATLTAREREVFDAMIRGKTSKVIANELGGSYRTIEIHRTRVMTKMQADHLADLVRMAFEGQAPT
jgi:FixJ family two-component response regulator